VVQNSHPVLSCLFLIKYYHEYKTEAKCILNRLMEVKINSLNIFRLITNTHFEKIDVVIAITMWLVLADISKILRVVISKLDWES